MKTCKDRNSVAGNWVCSNSFNSQDSDGDGLSDHIEVFGCDQMCYDASGTTLTKDGCYSFPQECPAGKLVKNPFAQELPKWGSDPRRADIFVEVDTTDGYNKTPQNHAEKWAARFNDPKSTLHNPDGSVGVRLHLDIGEACTKPTLCGKWGGHSSVPANLNLNQAYDGYFDRIRRHLFRYGLGAAGVGGQAPGDRFVFGVGHPIPATIYDGSWAKATHETGHTAGVGHEGYEAAGPFNCKPQYTSLMNYTYNTTLNGSIDNIHFSWGEFANVDLNPSGLCETTGLATDDFSKISFLTNDPFYFHVDQNCSPGTGRYCGVDWNRDGVIDDCIGPARAFINYVRWQECDGPGYRKNDNVDVEGIELLSANGPVLASFDAELYLFHTHFDPALASAYIAQSRFVGFAGCSGKSACDQWEGGTPITGWGASSSPALAAITMADGSNRLVMVYRIGADLYARYMDASRQWHDIGWLSQQARFDPALVNFRGQLLLMFAGLDSYLYATAMDSAGNWSGAQRIKNGSSSAILSATAPSLAVVPYFPSGSDQSIVHLVFGALGSQQLAMSFLDPASALWQDGLNVGTYWNPQVWFEPAWAPERPASSERVGFAWLPDAKLLHGGRFYLMYKGPWLGVANNNNVHFNFMTTRTPGGPWEWNMTGLQDNYFTHTEHGISMIYHEHPQRTGLWATFTDADKGNAVRFVPFADGLIPVPLADADDWKPMRRGICRVLRTDADNYCGLQEYPHPPPPPGAW
ncbi:MAG: hypothetical protein HY897_08025 [Deltaproteobacteria bacterium]|nr:hypothetical protein [Deltaproteobacteria bacterium]